MSEVSPPPPSPPPHNAFWSALTTVIIHAILFFSVDHWVRVLAPICKTNFVNWQMKLPAMTEYILDISDFIVDNPVLVHGLIFGFLSFDLMVLYRLSGPRSLRVLRELWSGLIVIILLAWMLYASTALIMPNQVVLEKLIKKQAQ
jgi:hypothetical protein